MRKKVPLSTENSLVMYEAQLTRKLLSNQAALCWSTLEPVAEYIFRHQVKFHTAWILIEMTGFRM